ncbi:uncharacterized protein LOC112494420 isoform X2 [Cephus cinctus]|nr:uncharacterized protein LOC112494420 isoform X2 [Cephus cinctus]
MNFLNLCEAINHLDEQQRRHHLIEIMNAFDDEGTKWTGSLKTIFELPDGTIKRSIALIDFDKSGNKYLKQLSAQNDECGNGVFKFYRILKIDCTGKAMIHENNLSPDNCMININLDQRCPDILSSTTTSELKRPDGCTELSVLVAIRNEADDDTAFSKITTLLDFCGNEIGSQKKTFMRDNCGNTFKHQENQNYI